MQVPTIHGVGFVVMRGRQPGYFDLRTWLRSSDSGESIQEAYEGLTFTELIDVMLAHIDQQRPGYQLLEGAWQPPLWDES